MLLVVYLLAAAVLGFGGALLMLRPNNEIDRYMIQRLNKAEQYYDALYNAKG